MKRLFYPLLLLPAVLLLAAVQEAPKTSAAPPSAQQAREQKNLGLRERVIAASLLPWRDPHPVLPLAGFSLDEQEAAAIEAIYAQARADYAAVSAGADEGVARRDVMARLYGRIEEYIEQNPNSAWVAGMRLQLGMDRLVNGAYATAATQYKAVWELAGRSQEQPSLNMAREASDLLARIYALTGRFDELAALEGSVTNSPLKRAVGQHWARAKDLQRWALAHPAEAYKCGLYCLDRLTRETQPGVTHPANFLEQESSPRGWSALELTDLAGRFGVKVEAVHVPDFARLPLPCVVHLGSEHFVFVAQSVNGFLQVIDPVAETPQWMLPADLAREATGCVLVAGGSARPDSALGLRSLTSTEAGNFRGRCHGPLPNDRHDPGPCPNPALEGLTDCESCETGPQPADDGSGPCPGCLVGMPYVRVSKPFLNPWVLDRPVSYEPAYGPKVSLDLGYNPRQTPSAYDANVFNAGSTFGRSAYYHEANGGDQDWNDAQKESGWSSGWGSHSKIGTSGNDAEVLLPGGRWADFDFSADPAHATSAVNYRLNVWLTKTLSGSTVTGLVLHFRNGSKVEYGTSKNGR